MTKLVLLPEYTPYVHQLPARRCCAQSRWFSPKLQFRSPDPICQLEPWHDGDHRDEKGNTWPLSSVEIEDRNVLKYLDEIVQKATVT